MKAIASPLRDPALQSRLTWLVVALAVNGLPDDETHRARFERLTTAIYEDLGLGASLYVRQGPGGVR